MLMVMGHYFNYSMCGGVVNVKNCLCTLETFFTLFKRTTFRHTINVKIRGASRGQGLYDTDISKFTGKYVDVCVPSVKK